MERFRTEGGIVHKLRVIYLAGMVLFLMIHVPREATANEPHLSVRTGFACSVCHTNHTGGGKRNDFGSLYAQTRLPMRILRVDGQGAFLSPRLNDLIAIGADIRARARREETGDETIYPFEIAEGNLYVEAGLIRDRVKIYADQEVAPGSPRSRELFVLLEGFPAKTYVKFGKFFLPFGFRLFDNTEFIRQETGFSFTNSDLGVEFGLEPGPLSVAFAVTNGTQGGAENNSDKQVSGYASLVRSRWRAGVSAMRNEGPTGSRDVVGAFGGFRLGRFVFLGEYEFINDDFSGTTGKDQSVAFVEGDLLVTQGLNLKVTYGFHDPDRDVDENARTRLRVGAENFITQFLKASFFYARTEDIPQADADRDEVTVELHAFF
jgi:hypothetical protein